MMADVLKCLLRLGSDPPVSDRLPHQTLSGGWEPSSTHFHRRRRWWCSTHTHMNPLEAHTLLRKGSLRMIWIKDLKLNKWKVLAGTLIEPSLLGFSGGVFCSETQRCVKKACVVFLFLRHTQRSRDLSWNSRGETRARFRPGGSV